MKKIILTLTICLFTLLSYSQIPTINEKFIDVQKYKFETSNVDFQKYQKSIKSNTTTDVKQIANFESHFNKIKDSISENIKKCIEEQKAAIGNKEKMVEISKQIKFQNESLKKIQNDKKAFYKENNLDIENKKKLSLDSIEVEFFKIHFKEKTDSITNIITNLLLAQNDALNDKELMIKNSEEIEKQNNILENLIEEENNIFNSFSSKKQHWFPSYNHYYRNYFFDTHYSTDYSKTALLTSLSATVNKESNTIQSELIADKLGCFRVSLGSVLSIASDESETDESETDVDDNNIERLINGGGNFYLDFTLPFFTSYTDSFFTDYCYFNFKGASDISGFGNDVDVTTFNGSVGITNYVGFSSDEKKFNFFVLTDLTAYKGNRMFYENLNLDHQRWFLNSNISLGVTLLNNYRIVCRTNLSSEANLRTERFAVGIQLLPNK